MNCPREGVSGQGLCKSRGWRKYGASKTVFLCKFSKKLPLRKEILDSSM
jgi:hypothetical protein